MARTLKIPRRLKKLFYVIWNRWIFLINGVNYGKKMRVYNRFYITKAPSASITIGDKLVFSSGDAFNPLSRNIRGSFYASDGAEIRIGNNVGISSACIWAKEHITIGDNVLIGADCIIMDTDAHNLDYRVRYSNQKDDKGRTLDSLTAASSPIYIEDDVLIGVRSIILKGVTIGARSIIGSYSVVTHSIPSDCIAGGNPCKVIKML